MARLTLSDVQARFTDLPTLPPVVVAVLRLLQEPSSADSAISGLLKQDPVLSAKVLRMVNSGMLAVRTRIYDIDHATTVLGRRALRSIVLTTSVISAFDRSRSSYAPRLHWLHAATVGHLAQVIAPLAEVDPHIAYVCGLLGTIGRLVLATVAADETSAVVSAAMRLSCDFTVAARTVLDTDDTSVGAWLCRHWDLGEDLAEVVQLQHVAPMPPAPAAVAVLQLAEAIARSEGASRTSGDFGPAPDAALARACLGVDAALWSSLCAQRTSCLARARAVLDAV